MLAIIHNVVDCGATGVLKKTLLSKADVNKSRNRYQIISFHYCLSIECHSIVILVTLCMQF